MLGSSTLQSGPSPSIVAAPQRHGCGGNLPRSGAGQYTTTAAATTGVCCLVRVPPAMASLREQQLWGSRSIRDVPAALGWSSPPFLHAVPHLNAFDYLVGSSRTASGPCETNQPIGASRTPPITTICTATLRISPASTSLAPSCRIHASQRCGGVGQCSSCCSA